MRSSRVSRLRESNQALNFIVSNSNSSLFSVQPSLSSNGQLTYTPAVNTNATGSLKDLNDLLTALQDMVKVLQQLQGLLTAAVLMILPFFILAELVRLLPPWAAMMASISLSQMPAFRQRLKRL